MEVLPFHMSLIKAKYIAPQINDSYNIFLLLDGNILIETENKQIPLKKDDILLVNPFQKYEVKSKAKNLFLYLRISKSQLRDYFSEQRVPSFDCDSTKQIQANKQSFQKMREILAHLMAAYFKQQARNDLEAYQYLFMLLSHLVKNFQQEDSSEIELPTKSTDSRMQQILDTIQKEYDQLLSLESLAEESGLSYHYLSRTFKKQMGVTFTEYLNTVRLIHAAEELLLTNQSIIKVALNNGFSNTKTFHQVFKNYYGMTPANFRKEHSMIVDNKTIQDNSDYQEISEEIALKELAKYLVEKDIEDENAVIKERVTLNLPSEHQGSYRSSQKIIKIGYAEEGLAQGVQRELTIAQKELHFDFIQFEGFCEETNFFNDNNLVSEYIVNNQLFDFLVDIQLRPMIQLCLPKELEEVSSVETWCDKQLKIIRHFLNRYGYGEVNEWQFQWLFNTEKGLWNELSQYGYQYFYRKLKSFIPVARIGIMSLSSLDEKEYDCYRTFVQKCLEIKQLPDFISFQADPYATESIKKEHAIQFKHYQQEILNKVQSVVELVNQRNEGVIWQPNIFLTEWNTLVGEGNILAGTFFRSALILESIIELSEKVTGIAFWLNIKVKERRTMSREDNSLSIFLYGELRRPLFFSLKFLGNLQEELLAQGEGYILTKNKDQQYQLLIYNSSYLDPQYSVDTARVQYQTKRLAIQMKNLPSATYLIRQYCLDKDHGGIYNDWIRVGGQMEIDYELQKYLEQKILPKFELIKETVKGNQFEFETVLSLNACQLYLFQPIY